VGVALVSLAAAAASIGFIWHARSTAHAEPQPTNQLRRSNAVRHRRRSLPDIQHHHDHHHERHDSDGSWTSQEDAHADENVDHNTVRPVTDGETVAEEQTVEDDWFNEPLNMPNQRAGQNIVSLLFRVSEDNARRNAYVHRGCQCNACGIVPIRGIRYRCANCADFDLCETCESQGLHFKTHIFYKIKVPAPRLGPRQMQPVWYPGDPESSVRNLPRALIARLSKETGFERPELEALWEQWTFMANTEWREDPDDLGLAMDRKTFERYLVPSGGYRHAAPNLLYDRIFSFYDTNNDDLIGFSEFLYGTSYRKRKDRLRKIFDGYDVDKDGFVSRRDFLRLFRAYYVLFKQMHRDIVEGLDDQVMNSTEVQQLITSRQPLSSLFGREGGFPPADPDRPLESKFTNATTGDVVITGASTGAVKDDSADTADRGDLLSSLFNRPRSSGNIFSDAPDNPGNFRFLDAILNPPTNIGELPAIIFGDRSGDEIVLVLNEAARRNRDSNGQEDDFGGDGNRSGQEDVSGASASSGAEGRVGNAATTDQRQDGSRRYNLDDMGYGNSQNYSQRASSTRRARVNARRRLIDRWRRRRFYLDEEEGALPPDGWKDDNDILTHLDGNTENFEFAHHPPVSPRSRSSSKVRFAEDTDDYEIRSNPSTSSRSVPERWGGMDIPDAERDAGKEVFYQVIQQAFNELLDILFKAKEDLAIEAAETKEVRDKYRPLFESINVKEEESLLQTATTSPGIAVESDQPVSESSLPELLAMSGYSVAEPLATGGHESNTSSSASDTSEESEEGPVGGHRAAPATQADSNDEPLPSHDTVYRDPTMPQFRPNSTTSVPMPTPTAETSSSENIASTPNKATKPHEDKRSETSPSKGKTVKVANGTATGAKDDVSSSSGTPIPRDTLIKWKRLDKAEEEAKARGGWGKLSYDEFAAIYKFEENNGSRLDYLGTWIDFCIPYH